MTIDDVANYCEFKDCSVTAGDPDAGFVHIDGTGIRQPSNYSRFLSFNELAALPLRPETVVEKATVFKIQRGSEVRALNREQFEAELQEFMRKVGV